jgi:iron complex outermembrane receptor protein
MGFDLLNNTRLEYQRPSNVFNGINLFSETLEDVAAGLDPESQTAFTDRFIEDGSFVRLQNLTLGYTFDSNWFRNLRVRNVRLSVSADNLFIITGYKGYDPEIHTYDEESEVPTLGIDYTQYPRARTFSFGLSLGL